MNMTEAVKSVLSQYVGFRGRARRSEFWYWQLATILASFAIAIVEGLLGLGVDGSGPVSTVLSLAILLPGLAVSFRRLHDTGRSGWWIGGFYLGLLVFGAILGGMALGMAGSTNSADSGLAFLGVLTIVGLLGVVIYSIALIVFCCQDSQPGPNKYGPNPKNEGNFDIFS